MSSTVFPAQIVFERPGSEPLTLTELDDACSHGPVSVTIAPPFTVDGHAVVFLRLPGTPPRP